MKKLFSSPRGLFLIAFALVASFALFVAASDRFNANGVKSGDWPYDQTDAEEVSLSQAWEHVDLKHYEGDATARTGILGEYIYIELEDKTVRAKIPYPSTDIISDFVKFSSSDLTIYEPTSYKVSLSDRLFQLLPIILLIGLLLYFLARGASKSLGLSSAFEVVEVSDLKEGFDDVAGIENARSDVEEIVQFLKNPKAISALGGRMPKGALFAGPPGTGKTLLARALAKEAGVPFLTIDATSVTQIFVGAGSMKLRSAFKAARKLGKCIIFIDEIDAMGRARSGSGGPGSGASDEKETTLNTLLVEMDGFDARDGVFIIAATNRPDILDPALTRAGRFDRRVDVTLPDVAGREEILKVHTAKIPLEPETSVQNIARTTYGMSGADLALLVNEAAILAALQGAKTVGGEHFKQARDRMLVGRSSSDRTLSPQEREITAHHEAGHAFIAHIRPEADPIEKATILPSGNALGYVMQMPDTDRMIETRARLKARLDVAVAGRVAELLFFGEDGATTGAQSDIEQATQIARGMVQKWGMTDKGFLTIGDSLDPLHGGGTETADAVRDVIEAAIHRVTVDMKKRKAAVGRIATELLSRETLDAAQIELIVKNKRLPVAVS